MKKLKKPDFIFIRRHEKTLKLLDIALAGSNASKSIEDMWIKIRKAWRDRLPDLEGAVFFKILDRELIPPYEQGGKYRYACSDDEADIWANLFQYDDNNTWRIKFGFDSVSLSLDNIRLTFNDKEDHLAWEGFFENLKPLKRQGENEKGIEDKKKSTSWYQLTAAVTVLLAFSVAGLLIWKLSFKPTLPAANYKVGVKPSIAVLPFVNMSEDPGKDYFCDGITEELINSLARIKDLRVISRTSAFYFKNKGFDLRTIGEKLGVDNILEGSVRISGDQLRISAQLVNVADDSHLWSENYDREMKDIFDTQENLAQEIACNLKSKLGCKGIETVIKRYTDNVEAYNLYLKARFIWSTLKQKKMIEYYNQAIALDPDYALAYIGLAEAHTFLGFFFGDTIQTSYLNAKEAALKAISIDDSLSDAWAALGQIRLFFEYDWPGAETAMKKAIALNPDSSMAHLGYGFYLRALGRTSSAVDELKLALDLDPFSFFHNLQYPFGFVMQGQYDKAIKYMETVLEMFPDNPELLTHMGYWHVLNKNFREGINILELAGSLMQRQSSLHTGFLGYAYGVSGDIVNAHKILDSSLESWNQGNYSANTIALIYSGLNEKDNAFEWLNIALEKRDPRLSLLKTNPSLMYLHSDPRWYELMRKLGLPD